MPSHKVQRNTEDIRRELTDILRGLKDPRITGMLSIVKVDVSNDFSHCKVYVSSMDGLKSAKTAVEGLSSAAGFVRKEIGSRLRLRRTPEFKFFADDGIEYSAELNQKFKQIAHTAQPEGMDEDTEEE